jgi:hypothetical protein
MELFSYIGTSDECILDDDEVQITYADAVFTTGIPTLPDTYVEGCLNSPITFEAIIDYPAIINIEPTPMVDITADALIYIDRVVPAGTLLDWDYNGGFSSTYTFTGLETFPVYLSDVILASDPPGPANTPFVGHNGLTDTWTFSITIPNTDNVDALANAGSYNYDPAGGPAQSV